MEYLVVISTLFISGSLFGYLIEVLFRRFVSQKRWVNPGFLQGPYLPLYGFGVIVLYALSNWNINIESHWVNLTLRILLIGFSMTLIEFITGFIFIKFAKIRLWDYRKEKGNVMGIICPRYSIIWLFVGSIYYFFLNKLFVNGIVWISDNLVYTYFIGAAVGAIAVDLFYSIHLATRLKKLKEYRHLRFEELKTILKNAYKNAK